MALNKIGPYNFRGILGRGGMGTVYRGVHKDTGEIHAVKVLAPTYAHDDHFRGRFESEIKALLKLDHPNIVQLLSYGQEDGMLFFSMELVEGNSLFQMERKGHRFDWREVLKIAKEVSNGLRHAHDRGVIHRDLKPGNLLMTVDESANPDYVKITDFGIAKRYGSSQNTGDNVLGTMDFMSPEQAKGEPVTIRSDLYSLGTVMYTLLSGRPPFTANSVEESLRNLTRVPAPHVSTLVPDVPDELDDMIKRLMAKRPENRIQTAQALLHQIEEVEHTLRENSEARTAQRPLPRKLDDTFQVLTPRTKESTRVNQKSGKPNSAGGSENDSQTIEFTDHHEEGIPAYTNQIDYFETVTEKDRKKAAEQVDSKPAKFGAWPLLMALVVVIALGGYGIYQASKPPSAEELFTKIEDGASQPNRVLEEIGEFLEFYSGDDRAEQVKELQRIGRGIELYNTLSSTLFVRGNLPGESRLTEVEAQFLKIVKFAETNPLDASSKMAAFVTVHDGSDLSLRDQKCVDAAKGYRVKILNDARLKALANLKQIRSAMTRAAQTTSTDDAIDIYRSIIELYGNVKWSAIDEAGEGRELVQKARDMLDATEKAKEKTNQDVTEDETIEADNDKQ